MPFNDQAFMQAKLVARQRAISVPVLSDWFEDEEPKWVVRGLTANELAKVNEAERRNKRESALIDALADANRQEIISEMQRALGRGRDTMPDLARRLELLTLGSVAPECSEELAVKMAEKFPVQFFELTNAVLELTGQGSDAEKKPDLSTGNQK